VPGTKHLAKQLASIHRLEPPLVAGASSRLLSKEERHERTVHSEHVG
jgi:hypothetical protein